MHERQRATDFIALQMADQMPADAEIGQRRGFVPKLLRPSFAQVAAAGIDEHTRHGGIDVLRNRDEPNGFRPAAGLRRRRGDATLHVGKVSGDPTYRSAIGVLGVNSRSPRAARSLLPS